MILSASFLADSTALQTNKSSVAFDDALISPLAKQNVFVFDSTLRSALPPIPVTKPMAFFGTTILNTSFSFFKSICTLSSFCWINHSTYFFPRALSEAVPAKQAIRPTYSIMHPDAAASFLRVLPNFPSIYPKLSSSIYNDSVPNWAFIWLGKLQCRQPPPCSTRV